MRKRLVIVLPVLASDMEKDKCLIEWIELLTSNHGIEPDRLSRLNALLYRVVTSEGIVSYDINDIEFIFSQNNDVDFVELNQRDESTKVFLARIIEVLNGYACNSTTTSIHIHFFVKREDYEDVINSIDLLRSNDIDTSIGVWCSDNPKSEVMLIISEKSQTYENNLHR